MSVGGEWFGLVDECRVLRSSAVACSSRRRLVSFHYGGTFLVASSCLNPAYLSRGRGSGVRFSDELGLAGASKFRLLLPFCPKDHMNSLYGGARRDWRAEPRFRRFG